MEEWAKIPATVCENLVDTADVPFAAEQEDRRQRRWQKEEGKGDSKLGCKHCLLFLVSWCLMFNHWKINFELWESLQSMKDIRECYVFVFTETDLTDETLNYAILPDCFFIWRMDQTVDSGKTGRSRYVSSSTIPAVPKLKISQALVLPTWSFWCKNADPTILYAEFIHVCFYHSCVHTCKSKHRGGTQQTEQDR
jgi:hypothetical protein